MKGYKDNIEKVTESNTDFRRVIYTGPHLQLVLMSLGVGEEIGEEIHSDTDQFFRIESGSGKCIIDGNEYGLSGGDGVVVPSGAKHNIINTGAQELKIYTLYAPPHHKDGIVRHLKSETVGDTEEFDGKITEG